MTVREFMEYFIEPDCQPLKVYSFSKKKVIASGYLSDLDDEITELEVKTIDNIVIDNNRDGFIILNVE